MPTERSAGVTGATGWERLALVVVVLIFVAFLAAIFAYNFRGQQFKHEEKLRQQCIQHGLIWADHDCQFPKFSS